MSDYILYYFDEYGFLWRVLNVNWDSFLDIAFIVCEFLQR